MKRRLISILLAAYMIVGLLPTNVLATEALEATSGTCGDNLTWSLNNGTLDISGNGPMDDYGAYDASPWFQQKEYITSLTIGSDVTTIGDNAFFGCSELASITIPGNVTSIGNSAFHSCTGLTSITIPNSVTHIKSHAFYGCSDLTNVTIPSNVISIGGAAFCGCNSITSITIPNGVTSIERNTFADCSSLMSVTIPNSVRYIGWGAFSDCSNLTSVTIPNGVTSIGTCAFSGCTSLTDVAVPSSVNGIGEQAFERCSNLVNILIPDSVTYIGDDAFTRCSSLTSVTIPNSVTSIAEGTFSLCGSLISVTIPDSVTSIGYQAFSGCNNLTDVYYSGTPGEWLSISISDGNDALKNATIHYNSGGQGGSGEDPDPTLETKNIDGVLRSGDGCRILWECSYQVGSDGQPKNGKLKIFTSATDTVSEELFLYNDSVETGFPFPWELPPYNLSKSVITTLSIQGEPAKQIHIPTNAFQEYTNLKQAVLNSVTGIDSNAFEGCIALQSVGFSSDTLKSIGANAFADCSALRTITLDRSVASIGANAFSGCTNLKIRCYENSVAHNYAQENNIPFELIDEKPDEVKIPWGGQTPETFEHDLDYFVENTSSSVYNPELSHMMITMCNAVHNKDIMVDAMEVLGFQNWLRAELEFITFNIGKKQMSDGTVLVLVVVRGTVDTVEWISNFDAFQNESLMHKGFADAADEIYRKLTQNVLGTENFSNVKFVITGHSRGAAAANLLEYKLREKGIPQGNLYGYNFACPDVATRYPNEWNPSGKYDDIFNISNAPDPVPLLPGVLGDAILVHLPGASWGKFGQSLWFSKDWTSLDENRGTLHISAHYQNNYLAILRNRPSVSTFKTWWEVKANVAATRLGVIGKLFGFCCPVDVMIEDELGSLVASVIGDTANYYNANPEDVIIITDGDRKAIFIQGNEPLKVRIAATDIGTMTYTVQTADWSQNEIVAKKVFSEVSLTNGKQMSSMTDIETVTGIGVDVSKVPLYVLDNNGQPELKVLPDGKGTEVPLDAKIYTIAFNANGGTVNPNYAITDSSGKLTSLPTPALTDYKFDGWFTAASGGTRITTETVFSSDTTIYAQWTKSSTNPGGTVNPSNPTYNPGGTYVPPIYNITLPNVPGGKISVNQTSASSGSTVTITTVPDADYKLTSLTVSDANGKNLELSVKAENQYTFKMPNGKVTITAQFQPINADMSWQNPFMDISESDWYFDAVKFVNRNRLMNGVGNGSFAPNTHLSRAMFAQILYNKAERPSTTNNNIFSDIPNGVWFTDAIVWATANNIVNGYNGQFKPNDPITREQLVLMLWRYEGQPTSQSSLLGYVDANDISDYALDAMCWAVENGVIKGKGNSILDPKGFATRAETAQILMNHLN